MAFESCRSSTVSESEEMLIWTRKNWVLGTNCVKRGVNTNPQKIKDIEKWLTSRDLKDLKGFLGLTEYYWRFVKDYRKIAIPLKNLLKKNVFHCNLETQQSFEVLKSIMVFVPMLMISGLSKEFVVETDAFQVGVRCSLDTRWQAYRVFEWGTLLSK